MHSRYEEYLSPTTLKLLREGHKGELSENIGEFCQGIAKEGEHLTRIFLPRKIFELTDFINVLLTTFFQYFFLSILIIINYNSILNVILSLVRIFLGLMMTITTSWQLWTINLPQLL